MNRIQQIVTFACTLAFTFGIVAAAMTVQQFHAACLSDRPRKPRQLAGPGSGKDSIHHDKISSATAGGKTTEQWEEEAHDPFAVLRGRLRNVARLRGDEYAENPWLRMSDEITGDTVRMAGRLEADAIVAATRSGRTALHITRFQPRVKVIAIVPNYTVARRLALVRSVVPVVNVVPEGVDDLETGLKRAMEIGLLEEGNLVVVASARPDDPPGVTSVVQVRRL